MFMFLILHSSVRRHVCNSCGHLVVSWSWSRIFFVPDVRALRGTEAESGRISFLIVLRLVGASAGDGLLLLHMRVAIASSTSHREPGRVAHGRVILIL
jgi:hypothetical protein